MSYSNRLEEVLPRFSLNRRISVLVLLASIIVVGVVAALGVPLELIPSGFSPPFLSVYVPWTDAPAEEVLEKIVLPLEDELSTVRGLDGLNSTASTGSGRCFLRFASGTDMDVAYREVRDRIERARPLLPTDADRIFIRKQDESAIPVFLLGLAVNPEITDAYTLIQNEIKLRLERIEGVASVDVNGVLEKEIFIELDRQQTEASGLNIYQLAMQLGNDNFTMASGDVRDSNRKLLLRSVARFTSIDELRARKVAPNVRLGDIAEIAYKQPDQDFRVRANSRPAVAVAVLKEGQANTLEVTRAIREQVERFEANPRLQDIQMVPIFDQGHVIMESLSTLLDSGRIGALFAIIVLYFFLRRLRMTLIITLAIPLSLLVALAVMFFAGESLNILSLLGLMISVGLLVDNSVVVAENIHRMHREGLPRREAAIRGAGEIALAITMATFTTIIVFLPVSLVEGQAQFFLLRLSLPISVALLASLGVAGIFVPLSVYLTLRERTTAAADEPSDDLPAGQGITRATNGVRGQAARGYRWFQTMLEGLYEASLGRLNRGYTRLLGFFLQHRLDLMLIMGVVFIGSVIVAKQSIKLVDVQEEERSGFEVQVRLPDATTIEEAEQHFLACERAIEGLRTELGLSGWFLFHRATSGSIQGFFENPRTVDISPREATERVLEALPKRPGVRYYTGEESQVDEASGSQVYVVSLFGEDATQLEETATNLESLLTKVPGVLGAKSSGEPAPNELALVIDRQLTQQQQISPAVVAGVVGYALRGQALSRFRTGGRDIPVRIRFREDDRETLDQLKAFYVPAGENGFVPLSSLTDVRFLTSERRIQRHDKRITRTITLELEEGRETEARQQLMALQSQIDLPEGIRFGEGAAARRQADDTRSLQLALGISIIFIYLLMGFLFESFILPLSIIFTIPLAAIGVIWSHVIAGLDMDFLGGVGVVLLVGVVVNNGIVLIDYVNRLRSEGMDRSDALLTAAQRRFRPIMMTALTTICGMIPVALSGSTSLGLSYTSFGLTLIGGLTTATLLTLLVVPVLYTAFDDSREIMGSALRRASTRRRASSSTEEAPAGSDLR